MSKRLNRDCPSAVSMRAHDAAARAVEYVRGHQSPEGGFCFYRWGGIDEPTLHDTWRALAIFALLGLEVPRRDEVLAFLRDFDGEGFDELHHLALALDLLTVELDANLRERIARLDAPTALADGKVPVGSRLVRAQRIVMLQRRLGSLDDPGRMVESVCEPVGHPPDQVRVQPNLPIDSRRIVERVRALRHGEAWGDKPNLADTWSALAILDACGEHDLDDATRNFVDDLQVASFGFTATRDSLYANLDTVYAGIRAAAVLELPLRYANDTLGFVLACQSDNGGFARTPDALPDFAFTHRALFALTVAGALPAQAKEA